MEAMRQNWTDDRMDDLARHMDAGFAQVRVDMGSMREEIKGQGRELNAKIERQGKELRGEIKGVRDEIKGVRGEIERQGKELRGEIKGVRDEIKGVRGEIERQGKELRGEIVGLREGMDTRLDALNAVFVESQRTMIQLCGGLCFALIAAVATLVSTVL
jgi:predicted  nucleic acid-binding Zn-ribbon protein